MLTIFLSALAIFIFGAFWFTFLFGRRWAKLMGFDASENSQGEKSSMRKPMILNFLSNLLIASVLYYILPQIMVNSFTSLLKIIGLVWLAFSFPIFANAAIWEKKSWELVLINSLQSLISLCIAAAIIYYSFN